MLTYSLYLETEKQKYLPKAPDLFHTSAMMEERNTFILAISTSDIIWNDLDGPFDSGLSHVLISMDKFHD
jgi:hypothetical protein